YSAANKLSPSFSGVTVDGEPVYTIAEPTESEIKSVCADYKTSFEEYSDAAIVVIGRPGSEAADYYPGETGTDTATGARNPLALSDDERDLIKLAEDNFDQVIVLINSSNAMEIGELAEDDAIDAILWIGFPGNYGMNGVADILTGEVSPSGALPDTFASDSTSSPAMANFGVYAYSNAAEYLDTATDRGDYYLIEAEGIYTGYRYYETRYADLVMGQGNADSTVGTFDSASAWNYDEEVTYAFGYGLSYTTFDSKLTSIEVSTDEKTIKATVNVTNTGDVAGKTSVQLYGQAPYIAGGVEKSAIVLVDFEKTDIIEPGDAVAIEITADLQNIASYDEDSESYILDSGDYYFTVGNGSHEAINNVLAKLGYDTEGNGENVQTWSYSPEGGVDTQTFKTTSSGATVSNKLSNADYNTWNPDTVTYLSRSDWEGTWPQTYSDIELTEDMLPYLTNDFYEVATNDDTSSVTYDADGDLIFANMKGLDYDDPQWDALLDQLSLQEAVNFITIGNRSYQNIDSVGFIGGQYTENGPNGFNMTLSEYSNESSPWYVSETDEYSTYSTNDMGSAPLAAATFNKDLMYSYGELWGNDSLFNGIPIIWAPGLNLHRSPYNGRNCEYYSEDPVLAGNIGLSLIQGGLSKGLIMAPKHFAFNDQESNRNGVAPYMTEQKARELELNSFRIAVEGGTLGLMTSFSRIGPTYVGADTGLMQGILYEEWGYKGYVVSDMVNPGTYMTWKESVIAGTTNFDTTEPDSSWSSYLTTTSNSLSGDSTMLEAIRERIHHTLYVFAQSNLMNSLSADTVRVENMVWWRVLYQAVRWVSLVLGILCLAGYVVATMKKRNMANE
nr:glycoside hydrolase family 3 C-terminal domain-containing protein [Butyrivibrio sp.]